MTRDDDGEFRFYEQLPADHVITAAALTDEEVPELAELTTVRTEHEFGAPVFFKPTLQDVLDQVPAEVLELLSPDAFSIAPAGDGRPPAAFSADGSRHVGEVTLYRFAT